MKFDSYDRKKLYEEVWNEPMITVSKRYGISGRGLAKVCRRLGIPTPGNGYWTKVKAGIAVERKSLPEIDNQCELKQSELQLDKLNFLPQDKIELIRSVCLKTVVPNQLLNPHKLVENTKKFYETKDKSRDYPRDQVLHISVSTPLLHRSLLFMDTLLKTIEALGYKIMNSSKDTKLFIGQEEIKILLVEKYHNVPHEMTAKEKSNKSLYGIVPRDFDQVPTKKLTFVIDEYHVKRKTWSDGTRKQLEAQIIDIIITLIVSSEDLRIVREKFRERDKKWKEEWDRRTLQGELQKKELKMIEELCEQANDYNQAISIIKYIEALEKALEFSTDEAQKKEMVKYIAWARNKADWINPIIAYDDPILGKKHNNGQYEE